MLKKIIRIDTHNFVHLVAISGIAFGIPVSKAIMSISMALLFINLLLEGNYHSYWDNLKKNKLYHLVLSFILLKIFSVTWSSNLNYAIHDLKITLPLLLIMTCLIIKPIIIKKHLHLVLTLFISSTTLASLINFVLYVNLIGDLEYSDIRGMSIFSSHIRFGLSVSFSIAILLYFLSYLKRNSIIICSLIAWLIFYTYYSQVISGYLTLFAVLLIYTIHKAWKINKRIVGPILTIFIGLITFFSLSIFTPIIINKNDYKDLPKKTTNGNYYTNNFSEISPITKKPIYILVCEPELKNEWPKYSNMDFDLMDKKGQPIKSTIIRYLSSKDYPKDSLGLSMLKTDDLKSIENGETNYIKNGIMARIYNIKYQLYNNKDPNNHSLLQRLEYWKCGLKILSKNYILGVGIGDVEDTFKTYYKKTNTLLTAKNQHRAHNMYLTIFISIGLLGILIFIFIHVFFFNLMLKKKNILGVFFVTIILISFTIEDTLETQAGITFYSLFIGLLSTNETKKKKIEN